MYFLLLYIFVIIRIALLESRDFQGYQFTLWVNIDIFPQFMSISSSEEKTKSSIIQFTEPKCLNQSLLFYFFQFPLAFFGGVVFILHSCQLVTYLVVLAL